MENQITSYKQSKRLIKMGVPAKKASLRGVVDFDDYESELDDLNALNATNKDFVVHPKGGWDYVKYYQVGYPAFTAVDLLEIIPISIISLQGQIYTLHIEPCLSLNLKWALFWGNDDDKVGWHASDNIIDLLEGAIEWILSNGYKLEL